MCGIVGYIGERNARPILINSLKRLQYRGYDSCGIALMGSHIEVHKRVGKIEELESVVPESDGQIGIGHTRWATHGEPSRENAHPHLDCTGEIAVVHNGVVSNFQSLREKLVGEGHLFLSQTDTEVISHLIERYYQGSLEEAVARALLDIEGSYAILALHARHRKLVAARYENPLVLGAGEGENFIASDVPALLDYTDRVIYLEDGDLGVITGEEIRLIRGSERVERAEHHISWSIEDAERAGYPHFMIKEIHEQPKVIRETLAGHISAVEPAVDLGITGSHRESILFLACGTSYHASLVGRHVIEELARIPVRAEVASEFNYSPISFGNTWAIGITQSGETADILRALKVARSMGSRTLALTNVVGSSVTRIADETFYIRAGPEISVAATKSFVGQLAALYLLALSLASVDLAARDSLARELRLIHNRVQQILDREDEIAGVGKYIAGYDNAFFIARGVNLATALEGALKLKEVSYIHAEGYPAGELKHGPFALLGPHTPVVAIATRDNTYETTLSSIKEVKARGAPVVAVAGEGDEEIEKFADRVIRVPKVDTVFSPIVNTVALQLLAYYAAKERGCPIDTPRNLAKSVTVE